MKLHRFVKMLLFIQEINSRIFVKCQVGFLQNIPLKLRVEFFSLKQYLRYMYVFAK